MADEKREYTLTRADFTSIYKGFFIAIGGAALTYLTAVFTNTDFSYTVNGQIINFTPVVYVLWSSVVNVARKWLDGIAPKK